MKGQPGSEQRGSAAGGGGALAGRFLAALVVVFLLFGPQVSMLLRAETRRLRMWTRGDSLELLAGMMCVAVLLTAGSALLRALGWRRLSRWYDHAFVVVFGAGLLANLWYHTSRPIGYRIGQVDTEVRTLWLMLAAVVGYALARPGDRLVRWARCAALIISPTFFVVAWDLLRQPSYPRLMDPLVLATPDRSAQEAPLRVAPVYVFVMDGWSYARSHEGESLQPWFESVGAFARQAAVFHDARSPAACTEQSMPALLMQRQEKVLWGDARIEFESGERTWLPNPEDSIFAAADARGQHTYVVGYFMPYRLLLQDRVGVVRNYYWPLYNRSQNPAVNFGLDAFAAMSYWTDPWSGLVLRKLRRRVLDGLTLQTYQAMSSDIEHIIAHGARSSFALFHYPMPHDPYLLDDQGVYRGPHASAGWVDHSDWPGYRRNLQHTDRLLGKWLGALRRAGKYDDALIILTSDHSWVYDPESAAQEQQHVPLFVKLPGQQTRVDVIGRFETWRLGRLIRAVVEDGLGADEIGHFVADLDAERQAAGAVRRSRLALRFGPA